MKPTKLLKEIRNRWKEIWMVRKADKVPPYSFEKDFASFLADGGYKRVDGRFDVLIDKEGNEISILRLLHFFTDTLTYTNKGHKSIVYHYKGTL